MRKRRLLPVAGACLATLALTASSALADPVPPQPPYRVFQGVGSDTSQFVMEAYGNGTTVTDPDYPGVQIGGQLAIANWSANTDPNARFTPKDPATFPQCQNIDVPNGSTDGVNALQGIKNTPNPPGQFPPECVDFARSSNNDSNNRAGANLTYIPFALDGLTYSTLNQSNVPKTLTLDQLRTIYRRNIPVNPGDPPCLFEPIAPQPGSGTRPFWRTLVGNPGTSGPDFGSCTNRLAPFNTTPPQEHDGTIITNPRQLVPFGVGQWVSQSTNPTQDDRRGRAVLRAINNESPFDLADFPGGRPLFNVVRNADINSPNVVSVFRENGQICSNPQVMEAFGLLKHPNCGTVNIQTPPN